MSKINNRVLLIASAIIGIFLFTPPIARASDVDRLLDLLVKKHVVSEQEASDLRSQIKADHGAPAPAASSGENAKAATPPAASAAPPVVSQLKEQPAQPGKKIEIPILSTIPLKLSGYVQARWTDNVGTNNPFEIRRARLILDGKTSEHTGFSIHIDAVKSPTLLDARFDWKPSPLARFTVGQFKIPFSQESVMSARTLLTVERTAVVNNLVPGRDNGSNGRDIGAMVEGDLFPGGRGPWVQYSVGIFNGAGINRFDDNRRKDAAFRLAVNPFKGLTLAGDYYDGATGPKEVSKDRADVEFAFVRGRSTLQGEYIWGHDGPTRKQGWYALAAYRFAPKLEGLLQFDTYDPDLGKPKNRVGTYLGGFNWHFSPYLKFQANYGLVDNQARTSLTNTIQTQLLFQF